jgi:hypothetical protein
MRRLVIAIDVDGVIADFVGTVRDEWGLPDGWEPACFNICDDPVFSRYKGHTNEAFAEWRARRWIAQYLRPYASEVSELESIMARHAQRAEFVFVTSPMASNRTWMHDREAWLRAQGFEGVPVIHTGRKDLVDADVLLDDKPEHVEAFSKRRCRRGVLRRRPWNSTSICARYSAVTDMAAFGALLDDLFCIGETEHEKCEREAIGL